MLAEPNRLQGGAKDKARLGAQKKEKKEKRTKTERQGEAPAPAPAPTPAVAPGGEQPFSWGRPLHFP